MYDLDTMEKMNHAEVKRLRKDRKVREDAILKDLQDKRIAGNCTDWPEPVSL